ncbi:hypothetical protein DCS_05596 [Drechmeria coniospora]|uniref:Uncharacterized protein n=1 Tax=Drechmeria coniospora TaxID=98403 RepID=A0A151GN95_DRECN|nr:hypothetical protein DCS_05596 [Drechmeria coniospora]KYK58579.1 hypothetical protein DCS_05596 [Drechmeria coniospora]
MPGGKDDAGRGHTEPVTHRIAVLQETVIYSYHIVQAVIIRLRGHAERAGRQLTKVRQQLDEIAERLDVLVLDFMRQPNVPGDKVDEVRRYLETARSGILRVERHMSEARARLDVIEDRLHDVAYGYGVDHDDTDRPHPGGQDDEGARDQPATHHERLKAAARAECARRGVILGVDEVRPAEKPVNVRPQTLPIHILGTTRGLDQMESRVNAAKSRIQFIHTRLTTVEKFAEAGYCQAVDLVDEAVNLLNRGDLEHPGLIRFPNIGDLENIGILENNGNRENNGNAENDGNGESNDEFNIQTVLNILERFFERMLRILHRLL